MPRWATTVARWSTLVFALSIVACESQRVGPRRDGGSGGIDSGIVRVDAASTGPIDAYVIQQDTYFDPDAFFAGDPPPPICYPDGGMGMWPDPPGGTPQCPDDNAREGCPCTAENMQSACFPGLRVNRNRGQCEDGVTTCRRVGEIDLEWGPCIGSVLPTSGALRGAAACTCFSEGRWDIANLVPCVATGNDAFAFGSSMGCNIPGYVGTSPPTSPPPGVFSTNTITVDCAGRFRLCYRIRAGTVATASTSDCLVAETCTTEVWYPEANTPMPMPDLPSWVSNNSACVNQFATSGGYGEMAVIGRSIDCVDINDGTGGEFIFGRRPYCSLDCARNPTREDCRACSMGGSGGF